MRKIAAHYILPITEEPIKYGVLTLDDEGRILEISRLDDDLREIASVEFYNGIIVPGLVNAHCHLELSHMQGILPQGKGMGAFCEGIMRNRNSLNDNEQQQAAQRINQQMYDEGVVLVGDISNSKLSFGVKQNSPVVYHTFIECLGLDADKADKIIQHTIFLKNEAESLGLTASVTPHAPYSMSERLFAESVRLANESGILSIHNQESSEEMQLFATGESRLKDVFEEQGLLFDERIMEYKNPLGRILQYVDAKTNLLLIHNVYTSNEDIDRVTAINVNTTWVLCPKSNLYIENKLPSANLFYNKQQAVAIGTDSLSSNTDISMMNELKTLCFNFPRIPINTLLYWATLGGAKALMKDHEYGSFELGKHPGLTLIENFDFENMRFFPHSKAKKLA